MVSLRLNILAFFSFIAILVFCSNDSVVHGAMSFNVRIGTGNDAENSWRFRRKAVVEMLNTYEPLVFGMQESQWGQTSYLKRNLNSAYKVGAGRWWFVPILYNSQKAKLISSGRKWLSNNPERLSRGWDAAHHRVISWVELQLIETEESFFVFNTHLDHRGDIAREESIPLIMNIIDGVNDAKLPVILLGDFNMKPDDSRLLALHAQYVDARICSAITDEKTTFNGFNNDRESLIIDYIFSKNLHCHRFTTIDRDFGVPFISDHYPILFEFSFVK